MASDEESELKLDDETLDHLDAVRKGKPRRFVMIVKGARVISLVVYKRGSLSSFKRQAKEAGRGVVVHGLVDGQGTNINFKLAREDGFDRAPVKTAVLREFLNEQSEYRFKPLFEIVDNAGPVLDTDDPLTARFVALRDTALAACDEHPTRANDINRQCREIGQLLDQDATSNAAHQRIEALERLLSELQFGTAAGRRPSKSRSDTDANSETNASSKAPPPPPPPNPAALKLSSQLAQLLKKALPYAPTIGRHVKKLAAEATKLIETEQLDDAKDRLTLIGELVLKARATEERKFEQRKPGDEKAVDRRDDERKSERQERHESQANEAKSRVKSNSGVVAIAKLKFLWDDVVASYHRAVANLELAANEVLETEEFEDDPRLDEARDKVRRIRERMPDMRAAQSAVERLIDVLNESDDPRLRERVMEQALRELRAYRADLGSEPLLLELQKTPAGNYPIYDHFVAALDRLSAVLNA